MDKIQDNQPSSERAEMLTKQYWCAMETPMRSDISSQIHHTLIPLHPGRICGDVDDIQNETEDMIVYVLNNPVRTRSRSMSVRTAAGMLLLPTLAGRKTRHGAAR